MDALSHIGLIETALIPVILATVWLISRIIANQTKIDAMDRRLQEHLDGCKESSRDVFSILNQVRGDLREIKGRLNIE